MNDSTLILLVEDEAIIATTIKKSLENHGYTILTANNGNKAIEICDKNSEIKLILMDLDLGKGIDGTEAAKTILKKREIPIVFLSSHIDQDIIQKIDAVSSYGYVVKNSGINVLIASMQMAFKLFDANRKNRRLLDAANSILNSNSVEEIGTNLLASFSTMIDADKMSLFLLDTENKTILLNINHGIQDLSREISYRELMAGLTGRVFTDGKAILSIHPEDGIEPEETKGRRYEHDAGSLIVTPLVVDKKIIGTITAINRFGRHVFTGDDVLLLEALTNQAADSIYRVHLQKELHRILAEKELILKEVHHRIKNNMNTIYGFLVLQAGTMSEPLAARALEDAGSRVRSMMMLYDKLYRSYDVTEISLAQYLPHLIDEIASNFPNRASVTIEKNIGDIMLDAKRLQPVGIIINELLTNIMKYAFTGRTDGVIRISALMKGTQFFLVISDNGNGMPQSVDFENSTGFGLVLVAGLVKQLSGTIRIERIQGTQILLEFVK